MIVPRGVIAPLALLVALATSIVLFTAGIGAAPSAFFQSADVVLGPPGGESVGRAPVDAHLIRPLAALPFVRAVSPEVYIPSSVDGRSVFARGVEFEPFFEIEEARLVGGRLPNGSLDALIGAGFAESFELALGDPFVLASPFARIGLPLHVVGIVESDTPVRDEILLDIETARTIAHLQSTQVHLVRVKADDPARVSATIHSFAPNITLSDIRIGSGDLVPGEPTTISGHLTNWGRATGTRLLVASAGGVPVGSASYEVAPRATIPFAFEVELADTGTTDITLNPTFEVNVREPTLRIASAEGIEEGKPARVRVLERDGRPAPDVLVRIEGLSATTDASGVATLDGLAAGPHRVLAERDGDVQAAGAIFIAEAGFAELPLVVPTGVRLPDAIVSARKPTHAAVNFENRGGAVGSADIELILDGTTKLPGRISLAAGASGSATIGIPPLEPGPHNITLNGTKFAVSFNAFDGDPRIEALLRLYEAVPDVAPDELTSHRSGEEYIGKLLGNVQAAVSIIAVAGSMLAALCAIAVLQRHIATRARSIGALKALGATDADVVAIAGREAARHAFVAVPLGFVAGALVAFGIAKLGVVRAFGHAVEPSVPWAGIGVLVLLSTIFVVVCARALVRGLLRAPTDALLRDEPLRGSSAALPSLSQSLVGERRR